MTDIIVEIMVAVLSFLALATKEMRRGRISKSAHTILTAFDSPFFGQQNMSRS